MKPCAVAVWFLKTAKPHTKTTVLVLFLELHTKRYAVAVLEVRLWYYRKNRGCILYTGGCLITGAIV
jgi:hypothetical protein